MVIPTVLWAIVKVMFVEPLGNRLMFVPVIDAPVTLVVSCARKLSLISRLETESDVTIEPEPLVW